MFKFACTTDNGTMFTVSLAASDIGMAIKELTRWEIRTFVHVA